MVDREDITSMSPLSLHLKQNAFCKSYDCPTMMISMKINSSEKTTCLNV